MSSARAASDDIADDGPVRSGRTPLANALLAAAVVAGASLPVYLTGAMFIQLSADLAFGAAGLGVVVGAYRGSAALGAVPLGRIADRIRPDRSLRLSLLLSALAMVGIASLASNITHLFVFLLLSGIAYALGQTSVNVFLSTAVPPQRQGMALGIKQAAIPLSGMLAGLAVPVLALTLGWRSAFWVFAGLAGLAILAVPSLAEAPKRSSGAGSGRRMPMPPTFALGMALAFGVAANSSTTAFLVDSAVSIGMFPGRAGLLLAVASGASITVRIVSGSLVDRFRMDPLRVTVGMLVVGASGYLLMSSTSTPAFAAGAIIALTLGWGYNGIFWLAVIRHSKGSAGASTGIILPMGMAGGVIGPLITGRIVEETSYALVWGMAGAWLMASAAMVVLGVRLLARSS